MLVKTYSDFSLKMVGAPPRTLQDAESRLVAHFRLDTDISPLFPYINRVAQYVTYFDQPLFIRFLLKNILCGLYPDHGMAAPFQDREEALEFLERLLSFINDIHHRQEKIAPNYKMWKPLAALDILRLLPRNNCRQCGHATCLAFAVALSRQETVPEACPYFVRPMAEQAVYPVVDKQGNLVSTVTIDIDPTKIRPDLAEQPPLEQKAGGAAPPLETEAKPGNPPLPAPLTHRELEVLRLLAQGTTNGEISTRLHISPHTVKSHVIHIFNKLGVSDRTQAAVWAARHHLV